MASDRVVLDASFIIEAIAPTRTDWRDEAAHLIELAAAGELDVVVPWLFFAEVAQVVTKRVRGRSIEPDTGREFLEGLDAMAFQLDLSLSGAGVLHANAQRWHCGTYDAVYLDIAQSMGLPIATRDRGLITAAKSFGVPVFAFT